MNTPSLKPIQLKEHTCKQEHYGDTVPKLPMRSLLVGPSGTGKTVLLTNMILDIYKGCFSRIYIWSPSIEIDNTWKPAKDYIRDHIKPNDKEKCYFDSYDPAELEQVINTQKKFIDYQKEQKHKDLYQTRQFHTKVPTITSVIHRRKTLHDQHHHEHTGL